MPAARPSAGLLPGLDALAAFLHDALGAAAYPADERGGVFRAGDGRPVARLGVALEAWPGLAAWAERARLDALFLHRPWRLAAGVLADGVGVLWAHLPFDDALTTSYNPRLAAVLGMTALAPIGQKDGRVQGMLGDWTPRPADDAVATTAAVFGGAEAVIAARGPEPVRRVAVVGAMNDALVREAAARGAGLYVTGQLRQPARAAVDETGLAVVAVGHARAEWWGVRALAHLVAERWGALTVCAARAALTVAAGVGAALAATPGGAWGQAVRVTVRDAVRGEVAGALVRVLDASGVAVAAGATGDAGVRLLALPGAGRYQAQVRRIGYRPVTTPPFTVGAADTVALRMDAPAEAVSLAGVQVTGKARCDVRRDPDGRDDATLFAVWDQVRTAVALSAERAGADGGPGPPPVAIRRYAARVAADGRTVLALTGFAPEVVAARPFRVPSLQALAARGYVWRAGNRATYLVPDEDVLLSEDFARDHCFRLTRGTDEATGLVGVAFEPAPGRRVPEVAGVLWVDSTRAALRYLDFWYVDPGLRPSARGAGRSGGAVHFAPLGGGRWGIVGWQLRAPTGGDAYVEFGGATDAGAGAGSPALAQLRARMQPGTLAVTRAVRVAPATDTTPGPRAGVAVSVRQRDDGDARRAFLDASGRPDAEGAPRLTDRRVTLDAAGQARFAGLPAGAYSVYVGDDLTPAGSAVVHPGAVTAVTVGARADTLVGTTRARQLCGALPARSRVVYGVVRTADGRPVPGATVTIAWTAQPDEPGGARTRTAAGGEYAFCRVPRGLPATVTAADARGNRTREFAAVRGDEGPVVERALLVAPLGLADLEPPPPDGAPADSAAALGPVVVGVVTDSAAGGAPLADAVVQFVTEATMQVAATATTDSLGRYRVGPLPPGVYLAGFMHPALDRRGLDQVAVRVRLPAMAEARVPLAAPPRLPGERP